LPKAKPVSLQPLTFDEALKALVTGASAKPTKKSPRKPKANTQK